MEILNYNNKIMPMNLKENEAVIAEMIASFLLEYEDDYDRELRRVTQYVTRILNGIMKNNSYSNNNLRQLIGDIISLYKAGIPEYNWRIR